MAAIDSLIVFIVSLLVGGLGIYVGGRVLTNVNDYSHAVVTALIGALVWAVVGFFFGWIPLLGPILSLIAYVGVINWRYPGGWVNAAGIALIAWVAALLVLGILASLGIGSFDAIGIPGV